MAFVPHATRIRRTPPQALVEELTAPPKKQKKERLPAHKKLWKVCQGVGNWYKRIFREKVGGEIAEWTTNFGAKSVVAGNTFYNISKSLLVGGSTNQAFSAAKKTAAVGKTFSSQAKFVSQVTKYIGFVPVIQGPLALCDTIGDVVQMIRTKSTDEQIDLSLNIVDNLGTMASAAVTAAEAVYSLGKCSAKAIAWAKPLGIISGVLSAAAAIAHIRGWVQSEKAIRAFSKEMGGSIVDMEYEDFERALEWINTRDEYYVKKHFRTSSKDLKKRVGRIWDLHKERLKSDNPETVADAKAKMQETMQLLKKRVHTKIWYSRIAVMAEVISIIATVILLFTPFQIVGLALAGVAALTHIAKFIYDRVELYRYNKKIRTLTPPNWKKAKVEPFTPRPVQRSQSVSDLTTFLERPVPTLKRSLSSTDLKMSSRRDRVVDLESVTRVGIGAHRRAPLLIGKTGTDDT